MKITTNKIKIDEYDSKAFDMYFGDAHTAVFDIETTGLYPTKDKIILTGFLIPEGNHCTTTQFFSDEPDDEKEIIKSAIDVLSNYNCIITYNGRSFDMPFLSSRAKKYNIDFDCTYHNLDLYAILNNYSELKKSLNSLSQKSVETFLGISKTRSDEINGYQSAQLYERYMNSKNFDIKDKIMLHNHDDIVQLYKLLPILSMSDLHKAMFNLGYPVGDFIVKRCSVGSDGLHISAKKRNAATDYISFPTEYQPYSIIISSSNKSVEITVPSERINGNIPVIDVQTILSLRKAEDQNPLFDLNKYPSFESGYLVLKSNGSPNYMEINAFVIEFLKMLSTVLVN